MTENNQNSVISGRSGYKNTATNKITVISSEALLGPQQRIIIYHQNESGCNKFIIYQCIMQINITIKYDHEHHHVHISNDC